MTEQEINLMLRNFNATLKWRVLYEDINKRNDEIIALIKESIAAGHDTITTIRLYVRDRHPINDLYLRETLDNNMGYHWTSVPGKCNTVHFILIKRDQDIWD